MNITPSMSASFAELRANHFHAGLDFSTSGTNGIEVHAVADGYVSRIKVSPYGYGHALYLTHPDGHTTVYAHLSRYVDAIAQYVLAEQYRQKSFEVDLYLKSSQFPVTKGQLVAFSGNTGGSGGPHLHFEVREARTDIALNPLTYLVPIADSQAPTVYGIKLYGMTDDAQVAGRCQDRYYAVADIEGKTVEVCGKIGLGMHAVDYFEAGRRPCGVNEIKLYDNDRLVFHSLMDSIDFDLTRFINSHIDYAERQKNKRFVQKSFVDPNNQLPLYHAHEDIVVAEGELHHMRYELTDHALNRRTVQFTLKGVSNAKATPRSHDGYLVEWGKTWAVDTLGISVLVPHGSLYRDEYISISELQLNNTSSIFRVGNEGISSHKGISISLPITEEQKALGTRLFVGQLDERSNMTYVGGVIADDAITVKTKSLGSFAVGVDSIPPKVWSKNSRTSLVEKNSVMVGISDDMSGIKKYNCYIDGQWKLFEYDYKNLRLISTVGRLGLEAGEHHLEAVIEDACGNVTRWEWDFTVVK